MFCDCGEAHKTPPKSKTSQQRTHAIYSEKKVIINSV